MELQKRLQLQTLRAGGRWWHFSQWRCSNNMADLSEFRKELSSATKRFDTLEVRTRVTYCCS